MSDPKLADPAKPGNEAGVGGFKDPTHTDHVRDEFMATRNRLDLEHKLPITSSRNGK